MATQNERIRELATSAWRWIKPGRPAEENVAEIERVLSMLADEMADKAREAARLAAVQMDFAREERDEERRKKLAKWDELAEARMRIRELEAQLDSLRRAPPAS